MRLHTNGHKQIAILRCGNNLNAVSMVAVKNRVARLVHRNRTHMILDLERTRRVNLAGLGILIERLRRLRSMHGDIRLIRVRPEVSETFRRAGAHDVLETFSSAQEAIRSYQGAA
jgi:anti-anti-sigma factor